MSQKDKSKNPSTFFGSKIKPIFIELHDYSFYHAPSEPENLDERFIGRKRVKEKLISLLTNNQTVSGAYLVTGFRGMGKTSLVNTVVSEISEFYIKKSLLTRCLRILFLLIILSFINIEDYFGLFLIISLLQVILISLFISDPYSNNLKRNERSLRSKDRDWSSKLSKIISFLDRNLIIRNEKKSSLRLRNIFQDLSITILIFLFTGVIVTIYGVSEGSNIIPKWRVSLGLLAFNYLLSKIIGLLKTDELSKINDESSNEHKESHKFNDFTKLIYLLCKVIKQKVNYSQRRIIRINLGHDDLKEVDILRMIAQQMLETYQKLPIISFRHPINTLYSFVIIICLYLFLSCIYHYKPLYTIVLDLKRSSELTNFIPSQYLFVFSGYADQNNRSTASRNNSGSSTRKLTELTNVIYETNNPFRLELYICQIDSYLNEYNDLNPLSQIKQPPDIDYIKGSVFMSSAIYIDYYLSFLYYIIVKNTKEFFLLNKLEKESVGHENSMLHLHFFFISPHLDYFFILFFVLGCLAINQLANYGYLGLNSHSQVKRRLEKLVKRLYAQTQFHQEQNFTLGKKFMGDGGLGRLFKKSEIYPPADIREIEAEIIYILKAASRIPKILLRPEFIFIFDELDKIDPFNNSSIYDIEQEKALNDDDQIVSSTERIRQRQQTIIKILSNLKHFLNTARAKFIFIAGREMFDASLADISNRDSFIGSIFHDVLYVNSFLTDNSLETASDITTMAETYVCQFLLPPKYRKQGISLNQFNNYLRNEILKAGASDSQQDISQINDRLKIIFIINQFVTYLTYRSSGAPKKITRLMESFLRQPSMKDLNSEDNLVVGRNYKSLYLYFSFHDQYALGLSSYLINPFFFTISRFTQDFGDKLLFSSSFLIDHLFKYHSFSFEWQNIELTPEIVDINKAPELREFIKRIIKYLSDSHLQEIVSGLHDFKFSNKTELEISYLSKISEQESAAMNFTLDESLELKNYFGRYIKTQRSAYQHYLEKFEDQYIHALGTNLMLLGDLHYFDQEFGDAISHYQEAIHLLRASVKSRIDKNKLPDSVEFLLLVRNSLKLGLVYERKNSYDFAYLTYSKISNDILNARFLNSKQYGLEEVTLTLDDFKNDLKQSYLQNYCSRNRNSAEKITLSVFEEIFINKWNARYPWSDLSIPNHKISLLVLVKDHSVIEQIDNNSINSEPRGVKRSFIDYKKSCLSLSKEPEIFGFSDNFFDVLEILPDTVFKQGLNNQITTLEGIRTVYQPFIAKLHSIEKNNLGGVTITDIKKVIEEYYFLMKLINHEEKFLVEAEFYNKLGDLMYFKGGSLENIREGIWGYSNLENESIHNKNQSEALAEPTREVKIKPNNTGETNNLVNHKIQEDFRQPKAALLFYFTTLKRLISFNPSFDYSSSKKYSQKRIFIDSKYDKEDESKIITELIEYFIEGDGKLTRGIARDKYLKTLATTLSEIGDTYLGSAKETDHVRPDFLKILIQCIDEKIVEEKGGIVREEERMKLVNLLKESIDIKKLNFSKIEKALCYFWLSSSFFLRFGQNRQYSFQLSKFLYIIKYYVTLHKDEISSLLDDETIVLIKENLIRRILISLSRAQNRSIRLEKEKMIKILNLENVKDSKNQPDSEGEMTGDKEKNRSMLFIYNNLSVSADNREVILLFKELVLSKNYNYWKYLMEDNNSDKPKIIEDFLNEEINFITPNAMVNSKFNRIRELSLKADQNKMIFEYLGLHTVIHNHKELDDYSKNVRYSSPVKNIMGQYFSAPKTCEFLILDSIFCLTVAIKTFEVFDISYMNNYSLRGYTYLKLAKWCEYYEMYYSSRDDDHSTKERYIKIKKYLGKIELNSINSVYNYEMALQEFYLSLEVHREGKAYKQIIREMYYLDDDFNDYYTHFCAGMERYRINTGLVRKWINDAKKSLNTNKTNKTRDDLYHIDNYIK